MIERSQLLDYADKHYYTSDFFSPAERVAMKLFELLDASHDVMSIRAKLGEWLKDAVDGNDEELCTELACAIFFINHGKEL